MEESTRAVVRAKIERFVRAQLDTVRYLHELRAVFCNEFALAYPDHTIWAPSIERGVLLIAIVWPNREVEEYRIAAPKWCAHNGTGW